MKKKNTVENNDAVIIEEKNIIIKSKNKNILEDIINNNTEEVISSLSNDIGIILASEFEDLPTHTLNFKRKMKLIISRAIKNIQVRNEKIVFNNLDIYCLIFIKKEINEEDNESIAADKLIEDFNNQNNKIIKIDYKDSIFIFFPDGKIKKQLKDSGFYDF